MSKLCSFEVKRKFMKYINFLLLGVLCCTVSCVTNKKFVYLQKDDVYQSETPLDTIIRTYQQPSYEYRVQPDDILSVRFESLTPKEFDFFSGGVPLAGQQLSQQANPLLIGELVDSEGKIPLPVIGHIKVAGLTIFEVQEELQRLAAQFLEVPIVKVRLLNFRATILGEVNREGTITFTNNRVSLLEAIGLAGGLTDLADKSKIKLIRRSGGEVDVQYLNLLDEKFIESPYFFLHQNDLLIIPALRQRPYRKYFGQNISLLVSTLTLFVLTVNLVRN